MDIIRNCILKLKMLIRILVRKEDIVSKGIMEILTANEIHTNDLQINRIQVIREQELKEIKVPEFLCRKRPITLL